MKWLLVAIIVGCTTVGEVLQAKGMRQHGEIHDFVRGPYAMYLARRSGAKPDGRRLSSCNGHFVFRIHDAPLGRRRQLCCTSDGGQLRT